MENEMDFLKYKKKRGLGENIARKTKQNETEMLVFLIFQIMIIMKISFKA